MISKEIEICLQDMRNIECTGRMSLEAQVRAYDLLEKLAGLPDGIADMLTPSVEFCNEYEKLSEVLQTAYDEKFLLEEARKQSAVYEELMHEAACRSKAAEELHEAAKETFDIWQNKGYFSRRKALRDLRLKAGFRLESGRIGNYVAKTFDLMNEAQMRFARAQQAVFASDVTYKVQPGLFGKIADILR